MIIEKGPDSFPRQPGAPARAILDLMEKSVSRAAHDLMLRRIEQSLKDEDRDNARMWIGKSDAECARAISQCSDLGDALIHTRGFPIDYGELDFPPLPRR